MEPDRYTYPVTGATVTDGDTYRLTIDPGLHLTALITVRLNGYDCPEKRSSAARKISPKERKAALDAQQLAEGWFERSLESGTVWVRTEKDPEKFGRWLGTVTWFSEGQDRTQDLGSILALADLATRWPTRWWTVYDAA